MNFDGNHPLIAGALGAFLRLVFVRPMNALEAICNLTVGAIVAWYGAPFLMNLFPEGVKAESRAAGLAGLILGFLSMWLLSWFVEAVRKARGNPFTAWKILKNEASEEPPPKSKNEHP